MRKCPIVGRRGSREVSYPFEKIRKTFRKGAEFETLKVRYNSPTRSWLPGMKFQVEAAMGRGKGGEGGHLDNVTVMLN